MITDTRHEILAVLEELSGLAPDVRLGQLLVNLSFLTGDVSTSSIWDVEDEDLLAAAKEHLEFRRACRPALAQSA